MISLSEQYVRVILRLFRRTAALQHCQSPNFALSSFHLPWHSARSSGK